MRGPCGTSLTGRQAPRCGDDIGAEALPARIRSEPRPGERGLGRALLVLPLLLVACGGSGDRVPVPGADGALKTSALARAERRAYDGAPPVMAHEELGIDCIACHDQKGMEVTDLGFAPPSPHEETLGMSAISRCRQCHVPALTTDLFAANDFRGLRQDLRRGRRLNQLAPPTMPHKTFMRENCLACHSGPAAREEIRTDHPERARCRQCHVPVTTQTRFASAGR